MHDVHGHETMTGIGSEAQHASFPRTAPIYRILISVANRAVYRSIAVSVHERRGTQRHIAISAMLGSTQTGSSALAAGVLECHSTACGAAQ